MPCGAGEPKSPLVFEFEFYPISLRRGGFYYSQEVDTYGNSQARKIKKA